jgi:hypothetical protein
MVASAGNGFASSNIRGGLDWRGHLSAWIQCNNGIIRKHDDDIGRYAASRLVGATVPVACATGYECVAIATRLEFERWGGCADGGERGKRLRELEHSGRIVPASALECVDSV